MINKVFRVMIVLCVLFQSFFSPLLQGSTSIVNAGREQNDVAGYAKTDFLTNLAGISSGANYVHNPVNPGTVVSDGSQGMVITSEANPTSFSAWDTLTIVYSGAAPEYQIMNCNDVVLDATPVVYGGPVNLNTAPYASESCLQAKVLFNPGTEIDDIILSWEPETVVLLDLGVLSGGVVSQTATVTAGECVMYQVRWSASYYDNPDTALYVQLPYLSGSSALNTGFVTGTITESYNQFPFSNVQVPFISDNGFWNSGETSVTVAGGLVVPPKSVYWQPDNGNLGSTHLYTFQLCTDRGTQTGVNYTMVAGIQGEQTEMQMSNTVSTTIRSTPQPMVSCTTNKQYLLQMINDSKVVEYTFTARHLDTSTEDLFSPTIRIDYADIVNDMVSACGISADDARARITVPNGFSTIDTSTNSTAITRDMLYTTNPYYGVNGNAVYLYEPQIVTGIVYTGSIDYEGCGLSAFSGRVNVGIQALNYTTSTTGYCDITNYTIPPSTASLGDYIWYDEDSDGLQGSGEVGMSGLNVELRFCDANAAISGQVYLTGMTDGSGYYQFMNLPAPAQYQVWFSLPNPNTSGFTWTTQTINTASGSDVNGQGKTACFTVLANENKTDIDAGVKIVPASTGTSSIQGWYNKCLFTNTTDESKYNSAANPTNGNVVGSLMRETNWENILQNQIGFYDNDCLDTYGAPDWNSHSTYVEVNASDPTTFYHLNYHGDLPVAAQLYAKQGVWSVDRINELYTIQGVDIWTNEGTTPIITQWSEDNATPWASRYCHTDTGTVAPLINTGFLDGTTMPSGGDLGTGWTTTCDGNSRWVVSYMRCIDSLYAPSQTGLCVGAPSRYQFRIHVTPTQAPDLMCIASATTSVAIPNTSYVYMYSNNNGSGGGTEFLYNTGAGGYVGTADQQSYITKTSPDLLLTGGSIFQQVYGPTTLYAGATGTYNYVVQNYSAQEMSGTLSIQIPTIGGLCPEIVNVTTGYVFDEGLCTITGPVGMSSGSQAPITVCTESISYKYEYAYDNSGNVILSVGYTWNTSTNSFIPADREEYVYDSAGHQIVYMYSYRDSDTNSWIKDFKSEDVYNSSGIYMGYTVYSWDSDTNSWIPNNKNEQTYDSSGNVILQVNYNWDSDTNSWRPSSKYEYTYDNGGNQILQVSYNWDTSTNSWRPSNKTEQTYDSSGNVILQVNYNWDTSTNSWRFFNKNEQTYDSSGNQILQVNYTWNTSTNSWIPIQKNEQSYDSSGNKILYVYSTWDTSTNSWLLSQKSEITYDSAGNKILQVTYTWNSNINSWIPIQKNEQSYDSSENQIGQVNYYWNTSTNSWIPLNNKYERVYDSSGNLIYQVRYTWNTSTKSWRMTQKYEATYDSEGNNISQMYITPTCTTPVVGSSASQSTLVQRDMVTPEGQSGAVIFTGSYAGTSICNSLSGQSIATTNIVVPDLSTPEQEITDLIIPPAPNLTPDLITHKYLDKEIISSSGEITYTIQVINTGDGLAEEIFITDVLPEGTELVSVTTSGGIIPYSTNGQSYNLQTISGGAYICPGYNGQSCGVYFSAAGITPAVITVTTGYSASYILNNFTLGTETLGVWSPESPVTLEDAKYVSVRIPALAPGDHAIIQIKVRNTINLRGDIIRNIAATIAKNLLQSLSNTVYTTLLPFEPNTIAGVVYHDANRNYSNTTGEQVFSGVTVWLYSGNVLMSTQITNDEGEYLFDGLPDGTYEVRYDPTTVPGYETFAVNTGTIDMVPVGATSGLTTVTMITLAGGDESVQNNFGLVKLNTIAGVVYHDENRNYTNTTGEQVFSGVTVTLYSGTTVIATTTTNSSGAYLFTGLVNGTYEVRYDPTTVPGYETFAVNTGTIDMVPVGATSGLTTVTMITLAGGDESVQNNFGLVKPTPMTTGGGGSSSVGSSSGGGSSGGGTSGGQPIPVTEPTTQPVPVTEPTEPQPTEPQPVQETVITLPFRFLQPKEFLPTGIKDIYDDLLSVQGLKTYVDSKQINTSAPAWFSPNRDEEAGKEIGYRANIVPENEWKQYYLPAEAILAVPKQGIVVPVHYPSMEGITDPNDETKHTAYLDYGVVQRAGSAWLGSDEGPILIEGHSASLVTNNAGPFGAAMKATVLMQPGEAIYAFVKQSDGTWKRYTYIVETKTQVNPDDTGIMTKNPNGTLFLSACGDDEYVGSLKARNIVIARLEGEAGETMKKEEVIYEKELVEAYTWAKAEAVTTKATIQEARMYDQITRGELAKMMVERKKGRGAEVEGSEGNGCAAETYSDYANADEETKQYMLEACTMGLMGRDGQGGTTKVFRRADSVSRTEFGAVLSRSLRGTKYDTRGDKRYQGHLEVLKAVGIMTKIDDPFMQEIRGYVMIMLMRTK